MNLLFAMTINGSFLFCLYLLLKPATNRYLTATWQQCFLKINMLFFLFPYQYYKNNYFIAYNMLFGTGEKINPLLMDSIKYNAYNIMVFTPDGAIHPNRLPWLFPFLFVWFIAIFVMLCIETARYFHAKRTLSIIAEPLDKPTNDIALHRLHTIFPHGRKKLKIMQCQHFSVPFSIGVFYPIIFLPKNTDPETAEIYLEHELFHVKSHDILWKFISFTVILLHWYNPFVYFLFREYCFISEKACDERVINSLGEHKKDRYAELIINASQKTANTSILFSDTFARNINQTKERITFMTRNTKHLKHKALLTAAICCIAMLSIPLSVWAYQPPLTINEENPYEYENTDWMISSAESDTLPPFLEDITALSCLDFTLSDDIFTDENGTQYPIPSTEPQSTYSCSHSYASGTLSNHQKQGNGCTVAVYEAQRCSKCGYILSKSLINRITFETCPH